ncbi:hypothetical protein MNV49_001760 [Pseudohyphozyma bogoriensis]|nr:hypothetical protein MNV49_001760 [Pseudohyphozyma bogoriensis]
MGTSSVIDSKEAIPDVTRVSDVLSDQEPDENAKWGTTSASHRRLESYHVNLIAMGGAIGTATFVYIGSGLTQAGPLGLLLGYLWWTFVIYCAAMCQMEMVVFWPTDTALARNAARFTAYEVTAFTIVLNYWPAAGNVNPAVYITVILAFYFVNNIWDTRYFGNAEFGFAMGKVLLTLGLLAFTFITMVGGNPIHDKYGFRYWKDPGLFTTPYPSHSYSLGRFEGFLAAVINAAFTVAGPEYVTMVAGETKNPRKVLPGAFRAIAYRLLLFMVGGALCVGIVVPYNDKNLLNAIATNAAGAGKSPYVIAMNRLRIKALPAIVNALILTSVLSAGNGYYYASSRSLAQMGRDGHAPKILGKRNRHGVPYVAVCVVAFFSLISYCQSASSAQIALTWFTSIVTANGLINTCSYCFTWIKFDRAMKAQGMSRDQLPTTSILMPYGAYFALGSALFVLFMQGYGVFLKGGWNVNSFIYCYLSVAVIPALFVIWKVIKKTKWQRSHEVDLVSHINDPTFDTVEEDERTDRFHRWMRAIF